MLEFMLIGIESNRISIYIITRKFLYRIVLLRIQIEMSLSG